MSGLLAYLALVPGHTLRSGFEATIRARLSEAVLCQAFQAGAVFQPWGPACRTGKQQPMQGGAATGLQVGFVPHRLTLVRAMLGRKP